MQAGKIHSNKWVLDYIPNMPKMIEPLMGYTSTGDMMQQIKLIFDNKEDAISYAEREGIAYIVMNKPLIKKHRKAYSDNFAYDRAQPWTH